jgi:alkaline phosphatase
MDHPVRTALLVLPLAAVATGVAARGTYASPPTNVILCIGDGMGFAQVDAASLYRNGVAGSLSFEAFPQQGQVTTYSANNAITDSAAAATAIATGQKVNNGVISMAYPGDGSELETVLEYWRDRGKRTGLVTTTYMTHATPAAFGAHEPSRNNTAAIGTDYRTQTRPNVLLGGGANGMSPSSAAASGYTVVTNAAEMQALDTDAESMVSGQFGTTHLPYEYDGLGSLPHLSDMTATALDILDNDPDGFFLMVEGGRIDHAGHANDIRRNIHETLEFSDTVQVALDWAAGRTDTMILVTADHETGGLTVLANNGAGFYPTVSWSSTDHTAVDVPHYAWGAGAELVSGVMNNTDLFDVMTIPEPTTIGLLCLGGLAGLRRRPFCPSGLTSRCSASVCGAAVARSLT